MKFLITNHMHSDRKTVKHGKIRIYINLLGSQRPIEKGDIAGDLWWRRTHKQPLTKKESQRLQADVLRFLNEKEEATINYDKYCGCSMCPCSPGYVVTIKNKFFINEELWVTAQA